MKLNEKQRERLSGLINEKYRTQVNFADKVGYTAQYINYIVNGRRDPSLEAIRDFASALDVTEEYLLCCTDFKNKQEKRLAWILENVEIQEKLDIATKTLICHAGYNLSGEYASNFEDLKEIIPDNQFETVEQVVNTLIECDSEDAAFNAADQMYDSLDIMIEIETPSGKKIAVKHDDYLAAIHSIEKYAEFAMKNLEHSYSVSSEKNARNGVSGDFLTNIAEHLK